MKKFFPVFLVILVSCIPANTPPNCMIVAPENGSEYSRGDDIQVYIEATDDDGEIAEVRLYLNGIGISSVNIFPYNFTLATAELEVGTYSLKAEVSDDTGKEAESEVSFSLTTGLPIVETLQPVSVSFDAMVVGGTIIDDGGGTISEAGILWSNMPYDVTGEHELIAEVSNSTFSITLTNLEYTTYYVTAFAENESGRSFGEQVSFSVPAPPYCEILEPSQGSVYAQGDTIEIHVSATDEDGRIEEVRYYVDSKPVAARGSFPYIINYPTAGLIVGTHILKVEAEDNSGIKSEDAVTFVIN
jgi:hypothetical protein